ncbi:YbaB/EbfC family nucleoid-associated protein [Marivirga arenosa]|uniref:Nucleoid-associated protein QYS47_17915 n=1 Tax=Marivirga arenosa TaxID=3059076 RepID=A0AA51ZVL9_9BACT|nr:MULTISPECIES: YbaB/EbfC family nucleoid-associated protein [unclassified Marivirga]WMN06104.1 YbaB/EbfC family nucleoid-associated protein [Marivirga sp. ABR2-2]WNB17564.1 YbaB/EbfC family nucleoid-associated protein [Marivirga sp. BKB1-2]
MFDMMKMMGQIKEVQGKVKQAQENLVHITADGEAGAGMVKATVNGKKQVISIEIDESLMNDKDKEMIQDLTVAAVNKAMEEVDGLAKEEMKKATDGVLPNIPGMDLGNMFNG